VSDEQRREAGCPARQTVLIQRGQATRRRSLRGTNFSVPRNVSTVMEAGRRVWGRMQ
jgi:hypothetical protein